MRAVRQPDGARGPAHLFHRNDMLGVPKASAAKFLCWAKGKGKGKIFGKGKRRRFRDLERTKKKKVRTTQRTKRSTENHVLRRREQRLRTASLCSECREVTGTEGEGRRVIQGTHSFICVCFQQLQLYLEQ